MKNMIQLNAEMNLKEKLQKQDIVVISQNLKCRCIRVYVKTLNQSLM